MQKSRQVWLWLSATSRGYHRGVHYEVQMLGATEGRRVDGHHGQALWSMGRQAGEKVALERIRSDLCDDL